MRVIKYFVIIFGLIFTIAILLAIKIFFYSETGLAISYCIIHNIFRNFTVEQYQGRLGNHFSLRDTVYRYHNIEILINDIHVFWDPVALLNKSINIKYIEAKDIQIYFMYGHEKKKIDIKSLRFNIKSDINNTLTSQGKIHSINLNGIFLPEIQFKINYLAHSDLLSANIALPISKNNHVSAVLLCVNLSNNSDEYNIIMNATVNILLDDLSIFNSAYLKSIKGIVHGAVKIFGTIKHPIISGAITLQNMTLNAPNFNIKPYKFQGKVRFKYTDSALFYLRYTDSHGSGTVNGRLRQMRPGKLLELNWIGKNLLIVNTKNYHILADPNLTIKISNNNISVLGRIFLPYFSFNLKTYADRLELPDEFRWVTTNHKPLFPKKISIATEIKLGKIAFVSYKNLAVNLRGRLFIIQNPGGLPYGQGEISIKDGTYRLYNRVFNLTKGRLIYQGNALNNPGLDIEAILQKSMPRNKIFGLSSDAYNNSIKFGVIVSGTLEQPLINLFSEPNMSQEDIFSYLIFGQPKAKLTGANALSFASIMTSNLNFYNTEQSTINPGLSILSETVSGLTQAHNFTLPISKCLQIKTDASINEISADLLYQYER